MSFDHKPAPSNRSGSRTIGKLFWGLLIIGTAILLLLNAFFPDEKLPIIKIIGSTLLLASRCQSDPIPIHLLFPAIGYYCADLAHQSLALLLQVLDPWLLLLVAFCLASVCPLSSIVNHTFMLISAAKTEPCVRKCDNHDEFVNIDVNFGEHIKHIHAENYGGSNKCHFASTKIYLNSCTASGRCDNQHQLQFFRSDA